MFKPKLVTGLALLSLMTGTLFLKPAFATTKIAPIADFDSSDINIVKATAKNNDYLGEYLDVVYSGGHRMFFVDGEVLYAISESNDCGTDNITLGLYRLCRELIKEILDEDDGKPEPPAAPEPKEKPEPAPKPESKEKETK